MKNKPTAINQTFINDIITAIHENDRKAEGELLRQFSEISDATLHRCLFEITTAPDDNAFFMLSHLIRLETISNELKTNITDLILDKARLNSDFAILFIEHADEKSLQKAVSVFANILVNETDTHILYEIIKVIGDLKETSCIDVVAEFIFYDNDELKSAAIETLEKIGGPSVIKRLAFASSTSKSDQQLLDTLERLQKKLSLDKMESAIDPANQFASRHDTLEHLETNSDMAQLLEMLNSTSPHDRHSAIDLLIETGVKAIPAVAATIDMNNSDSIINGLDILGNINNKAAHPPVLKILNANHADPNVRFAAYEAISKLPPTDSSISLINGIEDPSEQVRIAAATAINKNLSKVLIAGLTGKIETFGRKSNQRLIVSAIIDSHSGTIFSSLLTSDSFVFLAGEYLAKAHHSTCEFFIDLLNKRGTRTLANDIKENRLVKHFNNALTVFAVDDSDIMLKYYIRFFHTMGHKPQIFSNPEDALSAIEKAKPDIVTSDLNMLSMNGLQLTTQIRKTYNSRELPVIIITTQSDFVEVENASDSITPDGTISPDSFVNLVLLKPPVSSKLKPLFDILSNAG